MVQVSFFGDDLMKEKWMIFLSVTLFVLSYPPFDLGFLIYFAFVPLYIVLHSTKNWSNIFLFGFTILTTCLFFIFSLEGINLWIRIMFYVLLLIWIFMYLTVFFIIFIKVAVDRLFSGLLIAGSWVTLGLLSQKVLNFEWFLHLTQFNDQIVYNIANVFGIHLIDFLIIFVNYSLFQVIVTRKWKFIVVTACILSLCISIGTFSNSHNEKVQEYKVCVVQPNIDLTNLSQMVSRLNTQDDLFTSLFRPQLFDTDSYDFIVWPEVVINRWLFRIPKYREHLLKLAKTTNAYLVIGAPDIDPDLQEYNSVFVVSPTGQIQRFDKKTLVPFIEKKFASGNRSRTVSTEKGEIDLLICWESLSLQQRSSSALTFLLTSDLSMGKTYVAMAHSRLGVFNAIERGTGVVVASTTGPSMIINNRGIIEADAPMFRPFILKGSVKKYDTKWINRSIVKYTSVLLFLITVITIFRHPSVLNISSMNMVYWLIAVLMIGLLVVAGNYKMTILNRKFLPQNELATVTNHYQGDTAVADNQKNCINLVLNWYGLDLFDYLTHEQILNASIEESLSSVGYEMVQLNKDKITDYTVPLIVFLEQKWRVIKRDGQEFVEIFCGNSRYVKNIQHVQKFVEKVLIIKPIPADFD